VYDAQVTRQKVGTRAFAQAVVDRLGLAPRVLKPARFHATPAVAPAATAPKPVKAQVGVDVFLDWDQHGRDPAVLGKRLETLAGPEFALKMVTNRGVKVYPDGLPETFCTDHWRCRFLGTGPVTHPHVTALLNRVAGAGLDFVKTEGLYTFDGVRGYSLGQGE
jgi:isocitrate dehydrogenase